jgi:hypothetical protein
MNTAFDVFNWNSRPVNEHAISEAKFKRCANLDTGVLIQSFNPERERCFLNKLRGVEHKYVVMLSSDSAYKFPNYGAGGVRINSQGFVELYLSRNNAYPQWVVAKTVGATFHRHRVVFQLR